MTFGGQMQDGVIVFPNPVPIPNGTPVEVTVKQLATEESTGSSLASLLKYAGLVEDLPPDMARNHDYYLHGASKR